MTTKKVEIMIDGKAIYFNKYSGINELFPKLKYA